MKTEINGENYDISMILVSAEKYALGRQTYIVQWTCEFIANNLHLILEKDKKVMIRDIKNQEEYGYGMWFDKEEWMKLLKILENNIETKEDK